MLSYPQIGTHEVLPCRVLSVDLIVHLPPGDLVTTFFDCLALLPNLKTLDIFTPNRKGVFSGLNQKSAQFHSIRGLGVTEATAELVWRCPNVESVTIRGEAGGTALFGSRRKNLKKLKRVVGVHEGAFEPGKLKYGFWSEASIHWRCIAKVVRCFPGLREVCIRDWTGILDERHVSPCAGGLPDSNWLTFDQPVVEAIEHLRSLEHLAVVEIDLTTYLSPPDEWDMAEHRLRRAQIETDLNMWKEEMIQVLRDSPSKERKFVRWKASVSNSLDNPFDPNFVVVGSGELEVLPGRPL